ncbi:hypothetical protein RB195_004000 [Necator americanus]|uniref:7TM GPCR serpentine receptor class x (Srx) domain-containing protein n=1 Tax=Necator americanus TaxID=51031 RepID=A0ABR1DR94_NECAM
MEFDWEVLHSNVEKDPCFTNRRTLGTIGSDQLTIVCGLAKLGKITRLDRCIPHAWSQRAGRGLSLSITYGGIVAYFVLPYHFEYPWINFGFTTVTWVSVHTFDGIMTLLYNREFRSIFQKNRQL